jgi:hypothetical protein
MQEKYMIIGEKVERTWGWPFWSGCVVGLIAIGAFCQQVMFEGISPKSILGSFIVGLAPAILLGVFAQTLVSLVSQTHSGVFGPVHYILISLAGIIAVTVGFAFSKLPNRWQEILPFVIEPVIWISVLVVFVVARRKKQST